MGDHAPASEARTSSDRKNLNREKCKYRNFRDVKFICIEIYAKLVGEKRVITLRLQKQELDVIEKSEM